MVGRAPHGGGEIAPAGHNEGTSLREDTGYDEKCRDEKTQVRHVTEDLPQGRGCPALFHPALTPSVDTLIKVGPTSSRTRRGPHAGTTDDVRR